MAEEKKKRSYSQAQNKATQKYIHNAYDQIILRVRKDTEPTRATITQAAADSGMSLNAYIMEAISERMSRDQKKDDNNGIQ